MSVCEANAPVGCPLWTWYVTGDQTQNDFRGETTRREFSTATTESFGMRIPKKRLAVLREHIKAESTHNMEELLEGMTSDCFNDVCCVPKPFVGPKRVAERYRKHWAGFPDFKVRVRRFLAADEKCIVTENEWSGTHLGNFLGLRPSGKRVRVRALVVWHFRGDKLWGETVFFDLGSIQKQIGATVAAPARRRARSD